MMTQREIRRATRDKFAAAKELVERQNLLAAHSAEVAAFMLQGVDVSPLQAGRQ